MNQSTTTPITDNVEVALYAVEQLREAVPDWDDLTRTEKLDRMESIEPEQTFSTHNVLTQPYRAHLPKLINPNVTETAVDTTHMAFGDDGTAPSLSDTHLINEVFRTDIDDHADRSDTDAEYAGTVLVQSDEAVGLSLVECGLVTESDASNTDDMAVNRFLLDDPDGNLDPKDADHAVTVTVELAYQDVSEV